MSYVHVKSLKGVCTSHTVAWDNLYRHVGTGPVGPVLAGPLFDSIQKKFF